MEYKQGDVINLLERDLNRVDKINAVAEKALGHIYKSIEIINDCSPIEKEVVAFSESIKAFYNQIVFDEMARYFTRRYGLEGYVYYINIEKKQLTISKTLEEFQKEQELRKEESSLPLNEQLTQRIGRIVNEFFVDIFDRNREGI